MSKIFTAFLFFILLACANDERAAFKNLSPDRNPPEKVSSACYLSEDSCFTTVNGSNIENQKGDFTYPDPNNFSQPELRPQYSPPARYIDLTSVNLSKSIAPNFIFAEFASQQKGRYAVLQRHLVLAVQNIRDSIGASLRINSGYRSPGYNSHLDGAAKWSRHTYGDAVDLASPHASLNKIKEHCLREKADFFQIYTSHIHCDWRRSKLDSAFYNESSTSSGFEIKSSAFIRPLALQRQNLNFIIEDFEPEDEGELIYDWKIFTPSGDTIYSQASSIDLPREAGVYKVQVLIGGSILLEQDILWSE